MIGFSPSNFISPLMRAGNASQPNLLALQAESMNGNGVSGFDMRQFVSSSPSFSDYSRSFDQIFSAAAAPIINNVAYGNVNEQSLNGLISILSLNPAGGASQLMSQSNAIEMALGVPMRSLGGGGAMGLGMQDASMLQFSQANPQFSMQQPDFAGGFGGAGFGGQSLIQQNPVAALMMMQEQVQFLQQQIAELTQMLTQSGIPLDQLQQGIQMPPNPQQQIIDAQAQQVNNPGGFMMTGGAPDPNNKYSQIFHAPMNDFGARMALDDLMANYKNLPPEEKALYDAALETAPWEVQARNWEVQSRGGMTFYDPIQIAKNQINGTGTMGNGYQEALASFAAWDQISGDNLTEIATSAINEKFGPDNEFIKWANSTEDPIEQTWAVSLMELYRYDRATALQGFEHVKTESANGTLQPVNQANDFSSPEARQQSQLIAAQTGQGVAGQSSSVSELTELVRALNGVSEEVQGIAAEVAPPAPEGEAAPPPPPAEAPPAPPAA